MRKTFVRITAPIAAAAAGMMAGGVANADVPMTPPDSIATPGLVVHNSNYGSGEGFAEGGAYLGYGLFRGTVSAYDHIMTTPAPLLGNLEPGNPANVAVTECPENWGSACGVPELPTP